MNYPSWSEATSFFTPKAFRPSAQGWSRQRPTLGQCFMNTINPNGGCGGCLVGQSNAIEYPPQPRWGCLATSPCTQGSAFRRNPGLKAIAPLGQG